MIHFLAALIFGLALPLPSHASIASPELLSPDIAFSDELEADEFADFELPDISELTHDGVFSRLDRSPAVIAPPVYEDAGEEDDTAEDWELSY